MKTFRGLPRHAWSQPSRPNEHWTERVCLRCGIRKVTRHDGGDAAFPWTEFYDELGLVDGGTGSGPTPPCAPRPQSGVAA